MRSEDWRELADLVDKASPNYGDSPVADKLAILLREKADSLEFEETLTPKSENDDEASLYFKTVVNAQEKYTEVQLLNGTDPEKLLPAGKLTMHPVLALAFGAALKTGLERIHAEDGAKVFWLPPEKTK